MTAPPKLEPMTAPPKLERLIEALRRLGDAVVAEEHASIILARMIDVITPARGHDIGGDAEGFFAHPRGQTAGLARELRDLAGKARKAAGGGKLAFEAWLTAWAALPRRTQRLLWRPPVPRLTLAEEESSFNGRTIDRRALAGSFATPRFHMVAPKAELILPAIEAELVRLKGTDSATRRKRKRNEIERAAVAAICDAYQKLTGNKGGRVIRSGQLSGRLHQLGREIDEIFDTALFAKKDSRRLR
jgi:hypothetical protein